MYCTFHFWSTTVQMYVYIRVLRVYVTLRTCMPHAEVNLETVARGTSGFTGADLANLINQAALHGSAAGGEAVTSVDLEFAK